jgi:hypothetical protein
MQFLPQGVRNPEAVEYFGKEYLAFDRGPI